MKKNEIFRKFPLGSARRVLAHGAWCNSRGRGFSMSFGGIKNPRLALKAAARYYIMGLDDEPIVGVAPVSGGYNVVFCYKEAAGAYCGVRTWTTFKSKEEFDGWCTPDIQEREKVIAEGVSKDEAVRLTERTPAFCYFNVAVEKSRDSETGVINPFILDMEMAKVAFALSHRAHRGD
jgi:hypothetical protein